MSHPFFLRQKIGAVRVVWFHDDRDPLNDRDAASPEQKSLRIVTTIDFFME